MMGDDRAIAATYVAGKKIRKSGVYENMPVFDFKRIAKR